jgi:hypothetical protein
VSSHRPDCSLRRIFLTRDFAPTRDPEAILQRLRDERTLSPWLGNSLFATARQTLRLCLAQLTCRCMPLFRASRFPKIHHRAQAPMCSADGRRLQRPLDRLRDLVIAHRARRLKGRSRWLQHARMAPSTGHLVTIRKASLSSLVTVAYWSSLVSSDRRSEVGGTDFLTSKAARRLAGAGNSARGVIGAAVTWFGR